MKRSDSRFWAVLEEKYGRYWWPVEYPEEVSKDPFKNLIITVLSQNTSEANCVRAYKGLSAKFEITPEVLANADVEAIKQAIKSGGLYNVKSKRIKEISKAVLEKFNGDIVKVLALPKDEAKRRLMELPGIGNKTADMLLSRGYTEKDVMPVDTHFDRITKRIGLVKPNASYEEVSKALLDFIPREPDRIGGLFWLLAKYTCQAQKPKCYECPIITLCDYPDKTRKG